MRWMGLGYGCRLVAYWMQEEIESNHCTVIFNAVAKLEDSGKSEIVGVAPSIPLFAATINPSVHMWRSSRKLVLIFSIWTQANLSGEQQTLRAITHVGFALATVMMMMMRLRWTTDFRIKDDNHSNFDSCTNSSVCILQSAAIILMDIPTATSRICMFGCNPTNPFASGLLFWPLQVGRWDWKMWFLFWCCAPSEPLALGVVSKSGVTNWLTHILTLQLPRVSGHRAILCFLPEVTIGRSVVRYTDQWVIRDP